MPPQYWLYGLAPLNHLYTLARISCWPPEDGSIFDPKHVGVNFTWTFNVFWINTELWVHELVIIETGHIDARIKHEVWKFLVLIPVRDWVDLQGHSAAVRIMSMENSNDTIGNRTRDLPDCGAVPQRTVPPRNVRRVFTIFYSHLRLLLFHNIYGIISGTAQFCERSYWNVCFEFIYISYLKHFSI